MDEFQESWKTEEESRAAAENYLRFLQKITASRKFLDEGLVDEEEPTPAQKRARKKAEQDQQMQRALEGEEEIKIPQRAVRLDVPDYSDLYDRLLGPYERGYMLSMREKKRRLLQILSQLKKDPWPELG